MIRNLPNRRGVTLIELMVSMALTLVIMLVLGEGFKSTVDFVRITNSTGNMIYQLNGAATVMSRDIKAQHFLADDGKPNGGVFLGDQRLDWQGGKGWKQPRGGFFRIVGPQPNYEGYTDQEGFQISWAINHQLHFTSILPGGSDQNLYTVKTATGTYTSRAAEVAYFLVQTGITGPGGRNLYNLVRRYRLVALDDEVGNFPPVINAPDDEVLSKNTTTGGINTLSTVINPANRVPLAQLAGNRFGEDILLSNVLSCEFLVDWTPNTNAGQVASSAPPRAFAIGVNTDAPYDFIPAAVGGTFDTSIGSGLPGAPTAAPYYRIKSMQVTLRVWDPRMKMARQNTLKFAM